MLEYARHIIALFDEMEQEVRNPDMSGTLRVGASITVGTFLLPGYVKELTRLYPELRVEARIENSNNIEKCVLSNEIDLGVIEGIAHSRYISSESFHGDRLAFVCPPGHRFAGKQDVKLGGSAERELYSAGEGQRRAGDFRRSGGRPRAGYPHRLAEHQQPGHHPRGGGRFRAIRASGLPGRGGGGAREYRGVFSGGIIHGAEILRYLP